MVYNGGAHNHHVRTRTDYDHEKQHPSVVAAQLGRHELARRCLPRSRERARSRDRCSQLIKPLRLPALTSARGVRRAHGRLCQWVLSGLLDSITATRLSYILENIRKSIEQEQLALAEAGPVIPPEDYDYSRLTIAENATLVALLSKCLVRMPEEKAASTEDAADSGAANCGP